MTNKNTFKPISTSEQKKREYRKMFKFMQKYELNESFLSGISSLFLNTNKRLDSFDKSDSKALKSDWENVGDDLYSALNKYHHELCK